MKNKKYFIFILFTLATTSLACSLIAAPAEEPASADSSPTSAAPSQTDPVSTDSTPATCPPRAKVNQMVFGEDVDVFVKIPTEACAFQVNTANENYTYTGDLPKDTIATAHRPGVNNAEVFEGPFSNLTFWRITLRFPAGYPANDDIHKGACEILRKEIANGQNQEHPFTVDPGNITCP